MRSLFITAFSIGRFVARIKNDRSIIGERKNGDHRRVLEGVFGFYALVALHTSRGHMRPLQCQDLQTTRGPLCPSRSSRPFASPWATSTFPASRAAKVRLYC